MSSGKTQQSSILDQRFDTSDIAFGVPAAARLALVSPRVVRIPARIRLTPIRFAAPPPDDDGPASGAVIAVVTEDAEAIRIDERRDTVQQPPLQRPGEHGPAPTPINDDPTVPTKVPEDRVAARRGIRPLRRQG